MEGALSEDIAKRIGKNIETTRTLLGWKQEHLAALARVSQGTISQWEKGNTQPSPASLTTLARVLGVSLDRLTGLSTWLNEPRISVEVDNPKPIQVGPTLVDRVFRMHIDTTDGLDLTFRYVHDLRKPPSDFADVYRKLARSLEQRASEGDLVYSNGPNTRLIWCSESLRQLTDGRERKGLSLELGPVSWEEFSVYNCFLDEEMFPERNRETIRKRFASEKMLYAEGADLRWCQLSNILTVLMIPISRDGFGLVHRRSKRGVAVGARKLTSGVCENIHRFKDDADPGNPLKRINPFHKASNRHVDHTYRPTGTPSPLLAGQRGLHDEVSEKLYNHHVDGRLNATKIVGLIFDLELFNPHVVGVIPLECTGDEILEYIRKKDGREASEVERFHLLPLDLSNPRTLKFISEPLDWQPAGLAAFGLAIQYWEEQRKREEAS